MRPALAYAIAIALCSLAAFSGPLQMQGMGIAGYGNNAIVGVANITRGEIVRINYSDVKQYTTTIMNATFLNTGTTSFTERMEIHIENLTRYVLQSYFDGNYNLIPDGTRRFFTYYTPINESPGYYLLHVNASYAGKRIQAFRMFRVLDYWETPAPAVIEVPGDSGSGGSAGAGDDGMLRVPEIGSPRVVLSYQRNVALRPGETYIVPITIENRGTSSMYDVTVQAAGSGVVFDMVPAYIPKIAKFSSAVVLLSISVPVNAEQGVYSIDFSVISLYESQSGRVDVSVQESTDNEYILDMINNYLNIYTNVKQRLVSLTVDGNNVSEAYGILVNAHDHIQSARRYYDSGEYDKALRELETGKKLLEEALMSAEYSGLPPYRVYLPATVSLALIIMVALIILSVYHAQKTRKKLRMLRVEKARMKGG